MNNIILQSYYAFLYRFEQLDSRIRKLIVYAVVLMCLILFVQYIYSLHTRYIANNISIKNTLEQQIQVNELTAKFNKNNALAAVQINSKSSPEQIKQSLILLNIKPIHISLSSEQGKIELDLEGNIADVIDWLQKSQFIINSASINHTNKQIQLTLK
jgi:type II secretory pathway component PulM